MPVLGKKGKKNKKTADMRYIASALVPPVLFAAVPKTPSPVTPKGTGTGLASSLLNTSTLSRLFAEPVPVSDDEPFSDPESSLYDYQQMEEAGYVSVDFGTLERERAKTPGFGRRSEDNHQNNAVDSEDPDISGLYAVPNKGKYKKSVNGNSPLSLAGTTHNMRQAMQVVHDLPPNEEAIPKHSVEQDSGRRSGRHSHRTQRSTENIQKSGENLEMENLRLKEMTENLKEEVDSLKLIVHAVNKGDSESAQSLSFRKKIEKLEGENEVLKESVHRLNVELSKCQARQIPRDQLSKVEGLPNKGPIPSWLIDKKYLAPLFFEYDNELQAKDEIISKCKEELRSLKEKMNEIIQENNQLHMGSSGTECKQIRDQARLVLEENQLLLEQLDVQHKKVQDMYEAHTQEVMQLTKKLSALDFEKTELERELEETKLKLKEIKHKLDTQLFNSHNSIPVQEHINAIANVKRSAVDEKEILNKERENCEAKVKALQDEIRTLTVKVTEVQSENSRLHIEIGLLHKSVRRAQHKLAVFQRAVEQSEYKELFTQDQLANIIKVAEMTAVERDTYAKVAKERQKESKKAMDKAFATTVAIGKLEEKLKLCKMKSAAKFNTVADRMKYQDQSFNSQCQEYERELKCLRLLLKEKELMLQSVQSEKKEIELDLDHVWQAASSENTQIKNTLRKCMSKLRQHSAFDDILDNELTEKYDCLNLSADDEC